MKEQLEQLRDQALAEIEKISNSQTLRQWEIEYLGRKGKLANFMKKIKNISQDLKPVVGKLANVVKNDLQGAIAEAEQKIKNQAKTSTEFFDPTLPGIPSAKGTLHPITLLLHRIWKVFLSMNYDIVFGPEIENDYYNFQALNIPPDHPARDMQDTFYIKEPNSPKRAKGAIGKKEEEVERTKRWELLLRTHTSSASQVRAMEKRKPPVRLIATGKCYRRDDDISHTPMFHQFDGIAIDQDITFADLKGTLHYAMKEILEKDVKVRFRISYFPFVEPGAEFDVSCTICEGKGCPTCKNTGWLEMGGCGMIHPNVMKNAKYDSKRWQGFAFGFGIERPVMIKYKIPDIRLFFENDLRFLNQF